MTLLAAGVLLLAVVVLVSVALAVSWVRRVRGRRGRGSPAATDVLLRLEAHGAWLADVQARLVEERRALEAIDAEVRLRLLAADIAAQSGQQPRRRRTDWPPARRRDGGAVHP